MNATNNDSNSNSMFIAWGAIAVVWAILSVIAYNEGANWFMPEAASAEADSIDELFKIMLGIGTFIFLLVQTVLWWFVFKYGFMRDTNDETDAPYIHGNNTLELVWTIIPTIIVTFLTVISWQVLVDTTEAKENEFVVEVEGQRFLWNFTYPDDEFELSQNHILVVPEGETVRLEMESIDVIHAFWVPEFRVKQDVMPGRVSELRFTPTVLTGLPDEIADELITIDDLDLPDENTACPEEGEEVALENPMDEETSDEGNGEMEGDGNSDRQRDNSDSSDGGQGEPPVQIDSGYDIVCAELCGGNHGLMRGEVFVVTQEEYDAYIESLKANIIADQANQAYAARCGGQAVLEAGRALYNQYGCNTCHQLADAGAMNMGAGPSLNGIGDRAATISGYADAQDYIRTSIINPNAFIVDGYAANLMPQNFGQQMSSDELDLLVAYLALMTE